MKRLPSYLLCLVLGFMLVSCEKSVYKGYPKMDNGARMQFHVVNNDADMPQIGDHVLVRFTNRLADTLYYDSTWDEEYVELEVMESDFVGDMMAGILNMHVDDSATLVYLVDSMYIKALKMDAVPDDNDYIKPGMPVYTDIKLKGIIRAEQVAAQRAELLELRRQYDEDHLAQYYSDEKNKITETGLIILNVKGKGRGPKDGEVMMVNLSIMSLDGDTMLYLYNTDPVALVCGDEDLGKGFAEAMRYVPEGGEGSFVIPSKLAFDSLGYRDRIMPYTSLLLHVNNSSIMTMDEYNEQEEMRQIAEESQAQQRLAEEPERIAKFVKDYNIKVEPSETGVYYLEIETGTGVYPKMGDEVAIHYNLYNLDNKLIESSYGVNPIRFVLGNDEMLPGVEEGVLQMRVGGKSTVIAPSEMGFGGVNISKDLPSYSPVVFDIELVDVKKKPR